MLRRVFERFPRFVAVAELNVAGNVLSGLVDDVYRGEGVVAEHFQDVLLFGESGQLLDGQADKRPAVLERISHVVSVTETRLVLLQILWLEAIDGGLEVLVFQMDNLANLVPQQATVALHGLLFTLGVRKAHVNDAGPFSAIIVHELDARVVDEQSLEELPDCAVAAVVRRETHATVAELDLLLPLRRRKRGQRVVAEAEVILRPEVGAVEVLPWAHDWVVVVVGAKAAHAGQVIVVRGGGDWPAVPVVCSGGRYSLERRT